MAMLSLRLALAELNQPGRWVRWIAPVPIPRQWCAAAFAACAIFATGVALFSSNDLHRHWGAIAACAYLMAAAGRAGLAVTGP